jgi:hypothetical protein
MAMTPALSAETPAVLSTENIFGNAKMGYMAAKRIPEICSKLFCYCGCDLTDNHGSLLDCFTSDHGVDCNICQEEALLALKMQTEGKQLPEIQKAIDQKYVAEYNSVFDQPSEILKRYRENRLWKPTQAELANENVAGKKGEKGAQSGAAAATGTTTGTTAGTTAGTTVGSSNASPASGADSTSTKKGSCCGHK